ncbi:putative ubiquitin conjugating enzyme [Xylona heveae TC161]|uniref:Ubiquitin-conjugating enzyme E2 2 n=1 Tax=Xylona heveae (strain CBS 132557 / TC161) TaxID=1328760 RepID=A0A165GUG4_XYLHT|nr:putative ubiquitin conjugating enzyme [Xylona heveae TC161]KZF22609.1 putative ubiquitin conjugating enzyme [Xylona heveae TC161]
MSERILMNEYKTLSKEPWVNIEFNEENILEWTVALIVLNPDSLYYGGYFKAKMTFPKNYPYSPPDFKFLRPLYHPNIYPDGKLCISILHAPGEDEMSGESAAERWSPAQRVESVLISILSLLDDAEVSSPANVDAGIMLRKNPIEYKALVRKDVETAKKDIPEGFIMPSAEQLNKPKEKEDDREFWYDSDDDHDLGGSDSDAEMTFDEDDEDDEDQDPDSATEGE